MKAAMFNSGFVKRGGVTSPLGILSDEEGDGVRQGCPTYGPRANVWPATRFYVARQPVYNQLTGINVINVRQRFGDEL